MPPQSPCLAGLVIATTGVSLAERNVLAHRIVQLGGVCPTNFTQQCTHLLATSYGSDKFYGAARLGIPIVHPDWIQECWNRRFEEGFAKKDALALADEHKRPIFADCVVCTTGVGGAPHTRMSSLVPLHGGSFTRDLHGRVTHLVVGSSSGSGTTSGSASASTSTSGSGSRAGTTSRSGGGGGTGGAEGEGGGEKVPSVSKKLKAALEWGTIEVVRERWFWDCVDRGALLSPAKYHVDSDSSSTPAAVEGADGTSTAGEGDLATHIPATNDLPAHPHHTTATTTTTASATSSHPARRLTALLPTRSQPTVIPSSHPTASSSTSSATSTSLLSKLESLLSRPTTSSSFHPASVPLSSTAIAFSPSFTGAQTAVLRRAVRHLGGTTREEVSPEVTHYIVPPTAAKRFPDADLEELKRGLGGMRTLPVLVSHAWLVELLQDPARSVEVEAFVVHVPESVFPASTTPAVPPPPARSPPAQGSGDRQGQERVRLKRAPTSTADALREMRAAFAGVDVDAPPPSYSTATATSGSVGSAVGRSWVPRRKTLTMEARTMSPPKEQEQERREREREPAGWAPMQPDAEWSGLGVVERTLTGFESRLPLSGPLFVDAPDAEANSAAAPTSDLFMGMIFASTGLPADALDSARFLVRSRGGVWRDMPPVGGGDWWNVVSVTGASTLLRTPGEIAVTDVWLARCVIDNKLFEPSECGAWTPVSVSGAQSDEWKRCRIGVTNLDELDREEIGKIVAGFGARYTENFTRRNTHLIAATLSEPYGTEYSRKREMAQKWGVPVVSREWLFESCRAGRPVDVQAYRLLDQMPQEADKGGQEGQRERFNMENNGGGAAAGVLDTRGIKRALESPAKPDGGGAVGVGTPVNPPTTQLPEVLSRNLARAGGRFANPPANPPDFGVPQADPPSTPEARLPPSQMNRVRVFVAHKTTENNRDKLTTLVTDMGADVVLNLSDATHAVFGRTRGVEATQDFVAAKRRRLNIVSEYWLVKSRELGTWQPEARFPHTYDPAPVSAAELSNATAAAPVAGEPPSSRADSGNNSNVATAVEVPLPPPSTSTNSAPPPTTSTSVDPPAPPPRRTRMDIAVERREAINAKVLDLIADMPPIPARVKRRRMDEPATDTTAFVPPQPPPGYVFPRDSEMADLPPGSPPRIKPIPKLEIPTVTWHDPEIKNIKKRLMDMVSGGSSGKRAKADPASAASTGEGGALGKGKEPATGGGALAAARAPEPSGISVSRDSVSNVSTKSGPLTPPDPVSANTDKKRSSTRPEERQGLKMLASSSTVSDITPGGDAGTLRRHGRPVARPGATTTNSASLTTVTSTSGPSSVPPPSDRSPPKFLFSAVDNASRPRFKAVLERCGALVYDTNAGWKPDLTHLVVGKVAPTTDKLLAAVAAGAWVLKPSYIDACSRANSLVPEEPHEWPPESSPGTVLGYARHWRTTLSPHLHIGPAPRTGAFSAVRAYLVAGETTRDNVVRVLKTGGVAQMEIGKAPFKIADKSAFTHVLVDLNVRKGSNSEWKVLLKSGVPCYELQAFLTAVLTGGDGEGAKLR